MTYIRTVLTLIAVFLAVIAYRELFPGPYPPAIVPTDPLEGKIDRRVAVFKVEKVRTDEAVALLSKQSGIPIHVDWESVQAHVKMKDRPVSVDLRNVPMWVVLKTIFAADWTNQGLHFNIENGEVLVGLGGFFKREELQVRVYDLRDLLTDDYWGEKTPPEKLTAVLHERTSAMISLIQSQAQLCNYPFLGFSRADDGLLDGFAWETEMPGQLVVGQTSYGQRQIEAAIARYRAKRPFETVELSN